MLCDAASRVVAVGPDRNPVLTAVVDYRTVFNFLIAPRSRIRREQREISSASIWHETITWSKDRFYRQAGYIRRNHLTSELRKATPTIGMIEKAARGTKIPNLCTIMSHVQHILANIDVVLDSRSMSLRPTNGDR